MADDAFRTLKTLQLAAGPGARFHSLPALAKTFPNVRRLPVSIRIVLESVLRNVDGRKVTAQHVEQLAGWRPNARRVEEIPFIVARVVLQDFTGVPLLADLAAMRSVAAAMGRDPKRIEPLVPVDLVVDHSVMIDHYGTPDALDLNMKLEFSRNAERYQFMKWGMQAFDTFKVVPPGIGIVHQVNLEHLARGVHVRGHGRSRIVYPDTLVGTDSHTTMINGIGVVGWGVGGIEAEAGMLGQPVYFLTPDVVGVHLKGRLREGVTATDLVLRITEMLRREKVVGTFVEFFGEGTASLAVPDRATIANMAPEYGATMGFFPVDERTLAYFEGSGRTQAEVALFEAYFRQQGLFGVPMPGELDYSRVVELDLSSVVPSVAGPKRPQDRIEIGNVKATFAELFSAPVADNGFAKPAAELSRSVETPSGLRLRHGDVLIAAITSCTNTSNPGVMLAAGLLAKKAAARGLKVAPHVKTSLAPGSRVVTEYLRRAKLLEPLADLGFALAAYGCTTCIGNAGDLAPEINEAIVANDLVCAAVLSGNRNFEARIHPNLRANFLASPPLVVAYAIAGNMDVDLMTEPLGRDPQGREVFIGDVWPSSDEIHALMKYAMDPKTFERLYRNPTKDHPLWNAVPAATGQVYDWPASTYIAEPPFFRDFSMTPQPSGSIVGARALGLFGDSITTDHISPAGSIGADSPAGRWLREHGVGKADFNSYGARRGHHEVMMRGTFANVRIRNLTVPPRADGARVEGGVTVHQPSGETLPIYDAAMRYRSEGVPTVIFGGEEYGTGSSRDWAAKGTQLLGVRAVVARSFERIHRSNLVGMGVLPLQFQGGDSWASLGLRGDETFDIAFPERMRPQQEIGMTVRSVDGSVRTVRLLSRIDTPIEVDYFRHGGILPFVLRELMAD
ncbi:MAG: Aconitate hydratase precursor [Pseudomonadota bacterium]|jgi:aconitate hydratase